MSEKYPAENIISSMVHGMWQSRCLATLVDLGVPEIICRVSEKSGMDIEEIAKMAGCCESEQLYKIMRVMAQWGIGVELEGKRFTANKALELLRRDQDASMGHRVAYFVSDEHWLSALNLPRAVKTGHSAFELAHDMNAYAYEGAEEITSRQDATANVNGRIIGSRQRRREFYNNYALAMKNVNLNEMEDGLFRMYPWAKRKRIMDIGGAKGDFLAAVLNQPGCENILGVLFDLPHVVATGSVLLQQPSLKDRVTVLGGSVFEPYPDDLQVDTVSTKNLLCSFSESEIVVVLQGCCKVIPEEEGRVLIIEYIYPEPCEAKHNTLVNGVQPGFLGIHIMASGTGANARTRSEWVALLTRIAPQTGMKLAEVYHSSESCYNIFELVRCPRDV